MDTASNNSSYLELWNEYTTYRDLYWYYNDACIFAFYLIGIISSFLVLITLIGNASFSEPCFICYQGVGVSELVVTIDLAISRWASLNGLYSSTCGWSLFNEYRQPILDFSQSFTGILIVFLSLQRAVACLIPNQYYLWKRKIVCTGVTIGGFLFSAAFVCPQLFAYNYACAQNQTAPFPLPEFNNFGNSSEFRIYYKTLDCYRLAQSIAHLVSSTLAICGMLKATLLK